MKLQLSNDIRVTLLQLESELGKVPFRLLWPAAHQRKQCASLAFEVVKT